MQRVSQGGALSPVLFAKYIAYLLDLLQHHMVICKQLADDLKYTVNLSEDESQCLQHTIDIAEEFPNSWQLPLAAGKLNVAELESPILFLHNYETIGLQIAVAEG